MEQIMKNCEERREELADLLLDPAAASAEIHAHVAECAACAAELDELRAAMAKLDAWEVPEPNPYFLTRLGARLEEERAQPVGWLARWRARLVYRPSMHMRPMAATALTVMLLVGGGTYLDLTMTDRPQPKAPETAVVHDLQTLDNNAQLLDQLETISDSDNQSAQN